MQLVSLYGGAQEQAGERLNAWGVTVLDIRMEGRDDEDLADIRAHVGDLRNEELRRAWLGVVLDNCCSDDVVVIVCRSRDEIEHAISLGAVGFDTGGDNDGTRLNRRVDEFLNGLGYRRLEPDALRYAEEAQSWLEDVIRGVDEIDQQTMYALAQVQDCLRKAKAAAHKSRLMELEVLKAADPGGARTYDKLIEDQRTLQSLEISGATI